MLYTLLLVIFRFLHWIFFRLPPLFISTLTLSHDPFASDPFALYIRANNKPVTAIIWFSFFIVLFPLFFSSINETYHLTYGSLIPLYFILFIFFAPSSYPPRLIALGGSILTFFYYSFGLSPFFEPNLSPSSYLFEETLPWLSQFGGFDYHMAVDAVSMYFITLTNFVIFICILASWNTPVIKEKKYFSCFLLINFLLIHVFTQINLFLFFVFFEAVLIPMFFVIGVWGSRIQRIGAAYRFFLYTLAGSSFFLAALSYIYVEFRTLDLTQLLLLIISKAPPSSEMDPSVQLILWFFIFIGFAVKIPLVPVHTWLPEAHVEAPTAGSMLLAGVLLKMGGYGVFRFLLPLFPDATTYFFPFTATLCILSIIYGSAAALVHQDMKKIVAYSSVAHMGYSMLGIFSMTHAGIYGGIGSMISHGLISTALFYSVGLLYERYGTRNITSYGSIALIYPVFSFYFFIFCLANTGFPGTSSFFPEIAVLTGLSVTSLIATLLSASSVVLSAGYSLWLFARVCFAMERFEPTPPTLIAHGDLSYRESYIAGILLFFIIVIFGLFPSYYFGPLEMPVSFLLSTIALVSKLLVTYFLSMIFCAYFNFPGGSWERYVNHICDYIDSLSPLFFLLPLKRMLWDGSVFGPIFLLLPELYFVIFLCVLFTLGSFFPILSPKLNPIARFSFSGTAALSLFFFFLLVLGSLAGPEEKVFFNHSFYDDQAVLFFKLFLTVLFSAYFLSIVCFSSYDGFRSFEFPLLFLFSFLGMYLMLSCFDLLLFYLVLELQSFCFYILSAFRKNSPHSTEAGLKYFIMGALSSAFLLFGISLIYLFTSTTALGALYLLTAFSSPLDHLPFFFGLLFFITGLYFKLSFAPFHFWTPDVYDGSPLSVTSFYLTIAKVPLFFFTCRFLYYSLKDISLSLYIPVQWYEFFTSLPQPYYFIIFPSLLSLFVGSFGAICQVRIKRFFAYTSIAHTGYLGFALASSVESLFFYLFAYSLTNLAMFSLIANIRFLVHEKGQDPKFVKLSTIKDLAGLPNRFPYLSMLLVAGLFSMAGIPPLVGFLSKYYIVLSLLSVQYYFPVAALLFFSVVSTYYYLKTIRYVYFKGTSIWAFFENPPGIPLGIGFIFSLFFLFSFISADLFLLPFKLCTLNFIGSNSGWPAKGLFDAFLENNLWLYDSWYVESTFPARKRYRLWPLPILLFFTKFPILPTLFKVNTILAISFFSMPVRVLLLAV